MYGNVQPNLALLLLFEPNEVECEKTTFNLDFQLPNKLYDFPETNFENQTKKM